MPDIKRLNYFSGEFLIDRDFNEEQAYHRDLRRRHNLHLHTWGVANGLEVKQTGEKSLEIDPGMAIDKDGRELVLLGSETLPASGPANGTLYVRIEYGERLSDDPADQESASGAAGAPKQSKRWVERPTCRATEAKPADDGAVILLATVQLDDSGKIKAVDASIRTVAGSRIDPAADLRVRSLTADSAYLDCVQLGAFTDGDADEWPKVFWHRNLSGNWDEGLIKHSSARGVFKKAGFGVHMHKDREFGMWSTGWDPLFSVDGGSGNTYVKGSLSIGGGHDLVFRAGAGTPEDPNSPDDPGDIVFQAHDGTQKARIWSEPGSAKGLHLSGSDNTAKLTIDAGGNVGVGTTEPKAKLHVCAGGGFGNIKLFSPSSPLADFGYDGGTDNTFFFSHGGDQSGETRFRWDPSDRTLLLLKNTGDVSIPSGNVGIGTTQPKAKLDIDGSALLGSEVGLNAADMPRHLGAPLKSGFYQNDGVELPGDVPDTSHGWTHLIAARHSNQDNNHQLQIAASYSQNDRIFFRKLQTGSLTPVENAPWYEFATRDANEFQGMQVFKSELNVFGETSFLNNALRVDRSWLPSPVFSGVTYTTRVTLQCPTNDNSSIAFHSPGGSRTALVADGPIISTESGAYFAGDVGIGTLAPGAKLEVKGNIVFDSVLATPGRMHLDGGELLYLLNKSGVIVGKEWGGNGNLTVEGELVTSSTIRSPGRMHIHGEELLYLLNKSGVIVSKAWGGSGNLTVEGALSAFGRVGIGTTNPQAPLHVDGWDPAGIIISSSGHSGTPWNIFHNALDATGDYGLRICQGDRGITIANGEVFQDSDLSLKQDIVPMTNILDKVKRLRPVAFRWRDTNKTSVGFVAQDIEHIFPELVHLNRTEDLEIRVLRYSSFGVLAIAAIQEIVQIYEQRVDALEARVKSLFQLCKMAPTS